MKNLNIYLILVLFLIGLPSVITAQELTTSSNSSPGQLVNYQNNYTKLVNATEVITQNSSLSLQPNSGVSCNNGSRVNVSHYSRYFNLPCDYGINNGFHINEVMFGIDEIRYVPSEGYPITINIFSTPPYGHYPDIPLELEGTATYLADGSEGMKHINLSITATIPKGKSMVVEMVYIKDDTTLIYPGFNTLGESAPTYFYSPPCGDNTPVTMADIGFPGYGVIFQITGNSVSPKMNITLSSPKNDYDSKDDIVTVANNGGKLNATNKIMGTSEVHYMGGAVKLNPGFSVKEGAVFSALAHGCY